MADGIQTGVAYFETRAPKHVAADLDDMAASGATYVVHCFSEFDQRWQPDSVARVVRMTEERGLDSWIDPWGVGEVFGGEPFSRFGAFHPEAVQIRSDGRPTTIACLNQPAFRTWLHEWIDRASDIGGKTIFWDEPTVFFTDGVWGCRCDVCRSLWRDRNGGEMPTAYGPEVEAFIEQTMHDLLGDASLYARSKGMRNAVCIMPPEATNPGFRDWDRAASIPGPGRLRDGSLLVQLRRRSRRSTSGATRRRRWRSPSATGSTTTSGSRRSASRRAGRARSPSPSTRPSRPERGTSPPGRTTAAPRCRPAPARTPRPPGPSSATRSCGSAASDEGCPMSVYGVVLRELGPDDEREIVALWQACAGDRYPLRARLWRQLTTDNPDFQPSDVIVAVADRGDAGLGKPKPLGPIVGFGYLGRSRGLIRGRRGWAHEGWLQVLAVTPGPPARGHRPGHRHPAAGAMRGRTGVDRVRLGGGIHYLFPGVPRDLPRRGGVLRGARRPV